RNKDVLDSIKYAQRIQSSILPPLDKLKHEFPESFVLYQPRDIVSGDFYWFEKVGDFFITACADCTGHGVPGAFMSMIGTTLLSKAVEQKHVVRCEHALTELDKELQKTLQQTRQEDRVVVMDGMDIALIAINMKNGECHYSGANRPLYLIRDNEVTVYNSNRCSIGGGIGKDKTFEGVNIHVKPGDQLYVFTDGITDQFGGENNKKFKRDRLKKLLLDHCHQPMEEQHEAILQGFNNWKGENEQIDDILVIGIQIP
ncbi:MAG: SpoIIE family protein phosphatase, partial [Flavobacteriales bacterium]|nr:SpoIIE family protein phosphatase [Flavobacteriales bacterium]